MLRIVVGTKMPVFRRILLRVNTDFAGCPAKIDAWRGDECRSVRRLRNELRASHSVCLVRHGFVGSAPVSAVLHDCSRTRHGPVLFLRRTFWFVIRPVLERFFPVPASLHDCSRTRYGPVLPFAPVLLARYAFRSRTVLSRSDGPARLFKDQTWSCPAFFAPVLWVRYTFRSRTALSRSGGPA